MIGTWMLYSILVTALCTAAAHFAEAACLLKRREVRAVWSIALILSVSLMFLGLMRPRQRSARISSPALSVLGQLHSGISRGGVSVLISEGARRATVVGDLGPRVVEALRPLDTYLLRAWISGSGIWMLIFVVGAVRARRVLENTQDAEIDGVRVRVSRDWGPAVAGVLNYYIVIPEWVERLSATERAFVLTHESEHARARDPVLLAIGALFIFILPWNAALWYIHRRLRAAVEIDCDARVLRKLPDVTTYADLLINVGERTMVTRASLAAFAESASMLHTRIKVMAVPSPRRAGTLAILNGFAASTVLLAACAAPVPYALSRLLPAVNSAASVGASRARIAAERPGPVSQRMKASQPRNHAVASRPVSVRQVASRGVGNGEKQRDTLMQASVDVPADSLAEIARRLEPGAFDSTKMPSSVAVGLAFSRDGGLVSHTSTGLASDDEADTTDHSAAGPNSTIGGRLIARLFPGLNVGKDVQSLTIARIHGKQHERQVYVITLKLVR